MKSKAEIREKIALLEHNIQRMEGHPLERTMAARISALRWVLGVEDAE